MPSSALWRRSAVKTRGSSRHPLPHTKWELVDMSIDLEECDPESGVITQVLGRSYLDYAETRSHVGRELSEHMERSA
jgi:hypothetical protein